LAAGAGLEPAVNRGDVWLLDLGGRAGKRPAVILTRHGVIAHVHKLTVAEVTTNGKGYPTELAIGQRGNLPKPSFVQLDTLQTVSKDRFVKYLGTLDRATMLEVGRKAVLALGLEDVL
jgi:mRNA-degrading endonuclease toxin of MazEF toxin-antitoxin module